MLRARTRKWHKNGNEQREKERAHARKEKRFEIYTIDMEQDYNKYIYNVGVRTTE